MVTVMVFHLGAGSYFMPSAVICYGKTACFVINIHYVNYCGNMLSGIINVQGKTQVGHLLS